MSLINRIKQSAIRTFDPLDVTHKLGGLFSKRPGDILDISAAGAENYLRNLRVLQAGIRASAAGLISPVLTANVAKILTEHGSASDELGKALAGGALTIPTLEGISGASSVAPELSDLQTAVAAAKAGIPRTPGAGVTALEGAATGLAKGGLIGAAAGAVGGFLRGRAGQRNTATLKRALEDAQRLASPENALANMEKVKDAARAETFVSGQQAELKERAAVSRSGLTGTGVGTQAQIAASVAPQVAALRTSVGRGAQITGREVSARLGTPVRAPSTTGVDALAALAGLSGAILSPEELARLRFRRTPIQGTQNGPDDVTGSNIVQPVFGER